MAETGGFAAIYVVAYGLRAPGLAALALDRLGAVATRVVLVLGPEAQARLDDDIAAKASHVVRLERDHGPLHAYGAGLAALAADGWDGAVLLTGAHVIGPVAGWEQTGFGATGADAPEALAGWWRVSALDPALTGRTDHAYLPDPSMLRLSARVLAHPAMQAFWAAGHRKLNAPHARIALADALHAAGAEIAWSVDPGGFETVDPAMDEAPRMLAGGAPGLPVALLTLDPLLHDLGALDLKGALDHLRAADPELSRAATGFITRHLPMREFNTIADQYEVIVPGGDLDRPRAFGDVAVFIHAFYAEMMPEFWALVENLPAARRLFITTASEENRAAIVTFLADKGETGAEVRVVEQNRGRDMSSLFITWRDVVLSGAYEVALRLHSKRTPQVARQVGESFKRHLFDNLVGSTAQVAGILDRLEAEPDIGLVIPPLIHIGFGTLGHSWFNNREALEKTIEEMGLDVPLDADTPVAPNGTMYWFRCDALAPMFETRWKWEAYNREPDHVDGGLAHVQERLIGYAVQSRGYRVHQVMTPQAAARGYARLEYKLQLLASYLPTGNVMEQHWHMQKLRRRLRIRLYYGLRLAYGRVIRRWPAARAILSPLGRRVGALLSPKARAK